MIAHACLVYYNQLSVLIGTGLDSSHCSLNVPVVDTKLQVIAWIL